MSDCDEVLQFAETLILEKTDTYCSDLQRQILTATLQGERKTYDQLAEECGYSAKYVKQDVAPKLWQLFSQALDRKVSKSNVRAILEQEMRNASSPPSANVSQTRPDRAWPVASLGTVPDGLAAPPATTSGSTIQMLPKANILLVDDRPKNLRLLTDLLEEQGYEVQQAISGAVALQAVSLAPPDLMLLDINMPEMDGYSVCQQLKADPNTRDIPVIFVSALDEPWDKVKAFSSGGSDYISKPFKVVEVLARVENQLKIQQLQRELRDQNARLQHAIQELQRLAALDELTQVATRRRFDAYLLDRWQQSAQSQTSLSLMLCQVLNFSYYSPGGNPEMGDLHLYEIAKAIKQAVQGPDDLVSRYGTLTFAMILPAQEALQVKQTGESLLKQVETLQKAGDASEFTLSIGIKTVQPTPEVGLEEFLEGCDLNLQEAKIKGGNYLVAS